MTLLDSSYAATSAEDAAGLLRPVAASLAEHLAARGTLPTTPAAALLAEVEAAGLTGRGGAGFPTARKLAAVRAGAGPRVVIGNGAEGEPASAKDRTLLATNPHLVLDGLQLAARTVEASVAALYVHADARLLSGLQHAIDERRLRGVDDVPVRLVAAPDRFVSGEESAVASYVSGGPALPRSKPPRVFEAGAWGRPTLVQNVETLAHIAVIAREGAAAFRLVGPPEQPGPMLFTVSGAVHRPGVLEAPVGTTIGALVEAAGGLSTHAQAVLVGGYHGGWLPWPAAREQELSNAALRPHGLSAGAGVVVVLPADVCPAAEVARILRYLAEQSAGQCGPCVFGMPALARSFDAIVGGAGRKQRRVQDLATALERRGGCAHPDGTVRFLRSALTVFSDHLKGHSPRKCAAS